MKIHTRKKAYRRFCSQQATAGLINNAAGNWVNRSSAPDNASKRDFKPQSGGK